MFPPPQEGERKEGERREGGMGMSEGRGNS